MNIFHQENIIHSVLCDAGLQGIRIIVVFHWLAFQLIDITW